MTVSGSQFTDPNFTFEKKLEERRKGKEWEVKEGKEEFSNY